MADGPRRTVLLVSAFDSPAIRDDAAILSRDFLVRRATGAGPLRLLAAALGAVRSDVVFCWFLSVYGAVAAILASAAGRPAVIVLGGVDVARDPELGYGLWRSRWKSALARRALRSARRVLAVAAPLRDDAIALAGYDGANIEVLPTGYDPSFWSPAGSPRPEVLCVAAVNDRARLAVKGVDVLVEAARLIPEVPVSIVGVDEGLVAGLGAPPNVRFHPPVSREELPAMYRSAKVYCQPSRREGLPAALCEAMLCGAHPVVSGVGGMVHAVGATGLVVPPADPAALAAALRRALALPGPTNAAGRSRIEELFPLARRRTALLELMASL